MFKDSMRTRTLIERTLSSESPAASRRETIFSLVVANRPGVLGRIALVFSRRGYNIEALSVSHTLDKRLSRMLIQCEGDPSRYEELMKQARKIIDVVHVAIENHYDDEQHRPMKIAVTCQPESKAIVLQCLQQSSFQLIDFNATTIFAEKAQTLPSDEAFIAILNHYGKVELLEPASLERDVTGVGYAQA